MSKAASALILLLLGASLLGCGGAGVITELAKADFEAKDYIRTRQRTFQAIEKEPDYKDALVYHGWSEFMLGDYPLSREAFLKAHKIDPEDFNALLGLGWNAVKLGEFDEAEGYFDKAGKQAHMWERYLVYDGQGWLAMGRGNLDEAEAIFKKEKLFLEDEQKTSYPNVGLGWVALKRADLEKAKEHFNEGLFEDALCFFCHDGLARAALETGDLEEALKQAMAGIKKVRHNEGLLSLLDHILWRMGDGARTVQVLEDLARHYPDDEVHAARLAWGLYFTWNNQGALDRFQRYIEQDGKDPNARRGRGFALFRLGRYEEALPDLTFASQHEPGVLKPIVEKVPIPGIEGGWTISYNATSTLAWTYYRLGKFKLAEERFRQALQQHPGWADVLTGMGYVQWALGNEKEAIRFFQDALRIEGEYPDARRALTLIRGKK